MSVMTTSAGAARSCSSAAVAVRRLDDVGSSKPISRRKPRTTRRMVRKSSTTRMRIRRSQRLPAGASAAALGRPLVASPSPWLGSSLSSRSSASRFMTMMLMRRFIGLSRLVRHEQLARGQALHAQHAVLGQAAGDQLAARRVGAVGRELPVAVAALAAAERLRVGVAFERDPVRHVGEHVADLAQQLAHVGLDDGAAAVEHRPVLLVDDLDAQAVARHVEADLRLHRRQLRARRRARPRPSSSAPRGAPPRRASARPRAPCRLSELALGRRRRRP